MANITQQQEREPGPSAALGPDVPPTSPSSRLDPAVPAKPLPHPMAMPLVQSQPSSRLHVKPQSLSHAQPQWQAEAPLLLLIGHDQAGVQDVLFRLPRAVSGERSRRSEAALLPTSIPCRLSTPV